jgi:hypothetical protein
MLNSFKNEELVKVQGKIYPVVGGRLRLAHDENKLLSIETSILHYKDDSVVIQARITTEKGIFSGIGNASTKRDRVLANAIIELAETRAIARSLRFAGYGVEYTGFEEVGEAKNLESESKQQNEADTSEENAPSLASKSQLNTIFSLAQNINMSTEELRVLMQEMTGKNYSKELSKKDASSIINFLKQKESTVEIGSH